MFVPKEEERSTLFFLVVRWMRRAKSRNRIKEFNQCPFSTLPFDFFSIVLFTNLQNQKTTGLRSRPNLVARTTQKPF